MAVSQALPRIRHDPAKALPHNGKTHPPAGLQRVLLFKTMHNHEAGFEFEPRLAGRVQWGLCGP